MMMKATEIRKMSVSDLEAKLADLKKDLFFLRMQHATNQLDILRISVAFIIIHHQSQYPGLPS